MIFTQWRKHDQKGLHFHWKNKAYFTCGTLERKSAKSAKFCEICEKSEKCEMCGNLRKSAKIEKFTKKCENLEIYEKVWKVRNV